MKRALALILFIATMPFAYAGDGFISYDSSVGSTHLIQSLAGGGDFGATDDQPAPWNWSVGWTYQRSSIPNAGGDTIVDHTNDISADINWRSPSGWGVGFFVDAATTPAENLTSRGGGLTGSYKWTYGNGELEFHPYLLMKLNLASTTYKVTTDASSPFRRIQNKGPRIGEVSLQQKMIGPEFVWRPWEQWKFTVGANVYGYSRDIGEFQNQLDSQVALRLGVNGFANTVAGLPKSSAKVGVNWYFHPDWDFHVRQDIATMADDGTTSGTTDISFEYFINTDWRARLGTEIYSSTVLSDTLFMVGIEYNL